MIADEELLAVLEASVYPGAQRESIKLVMAYCRARGLDPLQKVVHIVPMRVKRGDNWQWKDVIMQGIPLYRIQASRTGEYAGLSEPTFGPDVTERLGNVDVTYPRWCKVTAYRWNNGATRSYTALEYWRENYATAKDSNAPNAMWSRRPYGQLAKCAEAQVLRKAFPEETSGAPTAEEMEGKDYLEVDQDTGEILENRRPPVSSVEQVKEALAKRNVKPKAAEAEKPEPERPDLELTPPSPLDLTLRAISEAKSVEELLEVAAAAGKLEESDKVVARAAYQRKQDDLDRPNR
jgi:phage recombination protein Bet